MENSHQKNIATFIHLSTFSRFIFPLGNIIAPIILWIVNKNKSQFIDAHGKQAINFQMSIFIYAIILGTVSVPFFVFNIFSDFNFLDFNVFESIHINISKPSPLLYITGFLSIVGILGFILEIVFIIKASLTAREGKLYNYPLTINFIK
ncbi:DUF4870 domain-containing protein [Lacinutrix undariae]